MNNMKRISNGIVMILVTFMIMSFYLFELEWWGRYILLGISLLVAVLYVLQNSGKFDLVIGDSFHRYVAAFSVFCFLSAAWAWNSSLALSKGLTIFLILACFALIYPYYKKLGSVDSLLLSIMLSGYGLCIYTFVYYGYDGITRLLEDGTRMDNNFTNVNSLGMTAAMSCIIQVYYLLRKQKRLLAVCMLPAILMIAVSQSRKAIIMLIIGIMLVIIFCGEQKNFGRKLLSCIAGIVVMIGMLYLLMKLDIFAGVRERLELLIKSASGSGREDIRTIYREIGWEQFLRKPILGIGMGNSLELLQSVGHRRTYLHCNYVELLASGGIVGFVCYYAMYLKLAVDLWKYRKYRRAETSLCFILMLLMLVMDYGMTSYYDKQQYLYLMCFFLQIVLIRCDHIIAIQAKRKQADEYGR